MSLEMNNNKKRIGLGKTIALVSAIAILGILLIGSTIVSHVVEAKKSKSGKIKVVFGDARGYTGKGKIKIWNLDNDNKIILKSDINFKKLNPSADCFCKTFSFKWKSNHVGDAIGIRVTAGGGGWTDDSGEWKLKKGTTHVSITLDEITDIVTIDHGLDGNIHFE